MNSCRQTFHWSLYFLAGCACWVGDCIKPNEPMCPSVHRDHPQSARRILYPRVVHSTRDLEKYCFPCNYISPGWTVRLQRHCWLSQETCLPPWLAFELLVFQMFL